MSKSDRLFRLLHLLRSLPPPVTAERLAEATEVSLRTLYRDIEALRAGGALIDGEAGYGYRLTEDPALPPQMFTRLEVEALVLGLAEVKAGADQQLGEAASSALAKITATLTERVQRQAAHAVLQVYRFYGRPQPMVDLGLIRQACWEERALDLTYADAEGRESQRRILPLSIVYMDRSQVLLAYCCLRQDFRKFLLHRMMRVAATGDSFRPRRVPLLRDYIARLRRGDEARRDMGDPLQGLASAQSKAPPG